MLSKSKIITGLAIVFYCWSLFLPGIILRAHHNVIKPSCPLLDKYREINIFYCDDKKGFDNCSIKDWSFFNASYKPVSRIVLKDYCSGSWTTSMQKIYYGWEILLNPFAVIYPAWWSNVLIIISFHYIFSRKRKIAVVVSVLAILLALSTYTLDSLPRDEAGNMDKIGGLGSGYYLWLLSLCTVMIRAWFVENKGSTLTEVKKTTVSSDSNLTQP